MTSPVTAHTELEAILLVQTVSPKLENGILSYKSWPEGMGFLVGFCKT